MKTRTMLMLSLMAAALMLSARVAQAQDRVIAKIPFDFAAGNSKLPAGEYTVKVVEATRMLLVVNTADPHASLFIPANTAQANQIQRGSKLVFNRYGDRYFLSQVWMEGTSRGRQLVKSKGEKEMSQVAGVETAGQIVLAATLIPATR